MLDNKELRTNFDVIAKKLAARGVKEEELNHYVDLDSKRRDLIVETEHLIIILKDQQADIQLIEEINTIIGKIIIMETRIET